MKTQFTHTRVEILPGLSVVIDGNSKITAGNGTYANPAPNAFSLPAASVEGESSGHCPGSTVACRASCYVRGLATYSPDVYEAYFENARVLSIVLGSKDRQWARAAYALGRWIEANCRGGFRWHVSGDVWNRQHAEWITLVCFASPSVRHWIYTRTFEAVPALVEATNLTVNVSADRDNYADARDVAIQHGARVAYMATPHDPRGGQTCPTCGAYPHAAERVACVPADLPDGSVVFPDYPLRGRELADPSESAYWRAAPHRLRVMTCPADFFGQSEAHRCGPCTKCIDPIGGP